MSHELLNADVLFLQRLLRAEGLYAGALDGLWGPRTERAARQFEARALQLRATLGEFDTRSEHAILGLALRAQEHARRFLRRVLDGGIQARIISGTRSYAQQNALFRQGRYGNPGPVVTRARGGHSAHNFGIAWDIGIFTLRGGYSRRARDYVAAARLGRAPGIEWGGDWTTFPDPPHYQLTTGLDLAAVRARFELGQRYA
ncbi:M15 family metallopeptidase [Lysobacter koreensis]|uniref:M15 family metallopeptidase n=1 Tax=Lysobacter koreensis TaxID=266122 RepID=A0ABW2YKS8_9GAMM